VSKAKFTASDVALALAEFVNTVPPEDVPGAGHNGIITVYKGKPDGQSKGPIDEYLGHVQPGLDNQ